MGSQRLMWQAQGLLSLDEVLQLCAMAESLVVLCAPDSRSGCVSGSFASCWDSSSPDPFHLHFLFINQQTTKRQETIRNQEAMREKKPHIPVGRRVPAGGKRARDTPAPTVRSTQNHQAFCHSTQLEDFV